MASPPKRLFWGGNVVIQYFILYHAAFLKFLYVSGTFVFVLNYGKKVSVVVFVCNSPWV
jgi:hypothetical protein